MKRAKKILCLMLALAMALALVACGSDNTETTETEEFIGFGHLQVYYLRGLVLICMVLSI